MHGFRGSRHANRRDELHISLHSEKAKVVTSSVLLRCTAGKPTAQTTGMNAVVDDEMLRLVACSGTQWSNFNRTLRNGEMFVAFNSAITFKCQFNPAVLSCIIYLKHIYALCIVYIDDR